MSRNNSIDSLKLICAMLVVFIHCEYSYKHSVLPITDVAVPLFFAISGYFVFGAKRKWKRVSRIANIFAWSAALYLLKTEAFNWLTTHQLWLPTWKDFTNLLFFNDVAFSLHLWYLPAYIYVLVIAFFIDKYGAWRIAMYIILPLLLAKVFIKYETLDLCSSTPYYRNAFFNGLPYFLLGAYCKQFTPPIAYRSV